LDKPAIAGASEKTLILNNNLPMKKSRFTETQIVSILKKQEAGVKLMDICREHGISEATFYNWKAKYGGMDASQLKRLKIIEEENNRLKKMYADLSLIHHALKDAVSKKL
jgi:putative transposase